jgi:hypothetical protein
VVRFAADENFNNDVIRGILRRNPHVDIVRIQDAGLSGADDPAILEWTASQRRILLTHDVSTLSQYACDRVARGLRMPGVFEVSAGAAVGRIIEDLLLLADYSLEGEWEGQVCHLPL